MNDFEQAVAIEGLTKSIDNLIDYLKKSNEKVIIKDHGFNYISDAFREISGSSHWPSSDPKDSPYNVFECKICGWKFDAIIYGDFNVGVDPYDYVKKRSLEHLAFKHDIGVRLYQQGTI